MAKAKRINPVFRYFVPFGLRQLSDVLILAASVLVIIGFFENQTIMIIGISCYLLASIIGIYRCFRVLLSGINKKSPEYRSAFINSIFVGIIFLVSIAALILSIFYYYA